MNRYRNKPVNVTEVEGSSLVHEAKLVFIKFSLKFILKHCK